MFKIIIKSIKKNLRTYLYVFFQMFLVSVSIIFSVSIYKDVYNKVAQNSYVMNLDNYSVLGKELLKTDEFFIGLENLEKELKKENISIPYYKNIERSVIKKTNREIDSLFLINKEFLDIKNFEVSEGEELKKTNNEVPIIIGSNITEFNVGDSVQLNVCGEIITGENLLGNEFEIDDEVKKSIEKEIINAKIVGRLSGENLFWFTEFTVPLNLDNSIVMFDNEKIELTIASNYFINEESENFEDFKKSVQKSFGDDADKVFLTMKNQLMNMIFAKDSPAYIIFVFMIVLTVVAINCIRVNIFINFQKRLKEFGIRISMGFSNNDIFKMIVGEFYIISILAYILGCLVGVSLQNFIPKQLGYTFDKIVVIISLLLLNIYIIPVLYSVYKKVKELTPNKLMREIL